LHKARGFAVVVDPAGEVAVGIVVEATITHMTRRMGLVVIVFIGPVVGGADRGFHAITGDVLVALLF